MSIHQSRQLVAIMFTDIVGYTALMGDDEQKAFELLQKNRNAQKPIVEEYGGKWIKELGDGILTSFNTVSDAVQAAIKIQERCNESQEFQLRIGIHNGEVVFDGDDVYGDAVNIASRLQAIAPVGGIWISESVHLNVVNKRDITTKFIKSEKLKNVREPVRIYEVILDNAFQKSQKITTLKNRTNTINKIAVRSLLAIAVAVIIILAGAVYFLKSKNLFDKSPIESIAVMPFVNESGLADMEYLSDGMTETLINSLSKLKDLSVKARSSVFRYKGKEVDPKKIGEELSVEAILNGRVAQRNGNIFLHLELVDVNTGNQIWGENYNRKSADLTSLQSEIANDVSNKLHQQLTGSGEKVGKKYTSDSEAYQLYLRGLFHWNKRTTDDLKKALNYFNQAKEKDPSFALAYAGLAVTYSVLPSNTFMSDQESDEALLKAKVAAIKALELDNNLAEAYAVLANRNIDEWDFTGAESHYKKAIELNPNYATAHQWYSELLSRLGRHEEALEEVKKAYELDPFSPAVNMNVGLRYHASKNTDEAIKWFKKTIELAPNYPMPYWFLGYIYLDKAMYEESLANIAKGKVLMKMETPESAEREKTDLLQVIKKEGVKGYWKRSIEAGIKYYKQGFNSPVYVAGDYAKLGDKEKAFEWLEKAYSERDKQLTYIKNEYQFDNIRSDPRFKDLLHRIGLPAD